MKSLDSTVKSIGSVDRTIEPQIVAHLNDLTKPPGSLGRLEEIALQYCLVTGTAKPRMGKKRICCFAGDHGVADEGVSAYPKAVTPQMVMNMLAGGAAINVLSRHAGADLVVVDMGVDDPLEHAKGLCRRKVRRGTDNFTRGPAMSVKETEQAIAAGIELAMDARKDGVTLIGTGDMGIANTTPATALFAAYLGCPVESITGRGTGIDDTCLQHKVEVIKKALDVNRERLATPLGTLAAVGGLEIAGICGLVLGAAASRMPVVVDGFIASSAALAACRICPAVKDYLFFSHLSQEQGHKVVLKEMDARPILSLDMRLGEGTGGALAMLVIEGALKVYNEMATFSSAGVSEKQP